MCVGILCLHGDGPSSAARHENIRWLLAQVRVSRRSDRVSAGHSDRNGPPPFPEIERTLPQTELTAVAIEDSVDDLLAKEAMSRNSYSDNHRPE